MMVEIPQQPPKSEWLLKPPSRVRGAAMWTAGKVAAGLQHLRGNCCAEGFGILMYHRVADNVPGVPAPTWNVTPEQMHCQLAGLIARGFESWPLSKLVAAHLEGRAVPANAFAVTFDDGYENNYLNAWPILRELKVHATIFLATKYLDTHEPFPFDDWAAAGTALAPSAAWRPLSTAQCEEMLSGGFIELAAHTHTHHRFIGRSAEFERDMDACLDELRTRFGIVHPTFAFPYGATDADLIKTARHLDISCAVTIRQRRVLPHDDVFQWGRFAASQSDTPTMLAAKLSGWYPRLAAVGKELISPFAKMASLERFGTGLGRRASSQS